MQNEEPSTNQSGPAPTTELGRLVRPVAALGIVALLFGRVTAPAIKGSFNGIDALIKHVDIGAGITSQAMAFASTALAVGILLSTSRDRQTSMLVRLVLAPQTALVFFLGIWATRSNLPDTFAAASGLFASLCALAGGVQGLRQPRTRALGVIVATMGGSALLHVCAQIVLLRAKPGPAVVPLLATASVVFHAAALLVALVWLASRRRTLLPPATFFALTASVLVPWASAHANRASVAGGWVFASRALDRLLPSPAPLVAPAVVMMLSVLSPALAIAALFTRRQIPAVIGALALALLAGPLVDAPIPAMILTLASLATVLASRDDRGMWEVLIGRPLTNSDQHPNG